MQSSQLVSFFLFSVVFIAIPGPNILVIVSTSLQAGKTRGLQTVLGTSLAMSIQLLVSAIGTSWLLAGMAQGLFWLKWIGVLYLVFLGVKSLYNFSQGKISPVPSALGSFQRGFWISLTNPKTILFFSAFLPQFVNGDSPYGQQIALFSVCFWLLAITINSLYALIAAKSKRLIASQSFDKIHDGFSGALYLTAGTLLANSNKV